ncbi:hypothetical protein E2C01_093732 [Portunus trituberculatus]|uniref:Uncharacterized protein n=1 Tax=Portunus trituberculatus TaxID=210409 RepID=A0A5B7K166_PORTR|nr:hypothetical protein [Portunus trituberculatus]
MISRETRRGKARRGEAMEINEKVIFGVLTEVRSEDFSRPTLAFN